METYIIISLSPHADDVVWTVGKMNAVVGASNHLKQASFMWKPQETRPVRVEETIQDGEP